MLPAMDIIPEYDFDTESFDAEDAEKFVTRNPMIEAILAEATSDLARDMKQIREIVRVMGVYHGTKRAHLDAYETYRRYVKIARYIAVFCSLFAAAFFIGTSAANLQSVQKYGALLAGGVFALIALYSGHIVYIFAHTAYESDDMWNKSLIVSQLHIDASILKLAIDANTDFLRFSTQRPEDKTPYPIQTEH